MVGVCVLGDDDVRQVVVGDGTNGILAGARPVTVIAIHATVAPATVTALEPLAEARGAHILDAPVSGGSSGALVGTMTVMVGGSDEALALARPALELFATTIPHMGPVGSAQVMKLLNNNLCYANVAMAISALRIAGQLGIDVERAAEIMRVSSGASRGLDLVSNPAILARAASPTSAVGKDVRLFLELMEAADLAGSALAEVSSTTVGELARFARER